MTDPRLIVAAALVLWTVIAVLVAVGFGTTARTLDRPAPTPPAPADDRTTYTHN